MREGKDVRVAQSEAPAGWEEKLTDSGNCLAEEQQNQEGRQGIAARP